MPRLGQAAWNSQLPLRSVQPLFDRALARYAEAERLRPHGNDDAILRWNSCVRALEAAGRASPAGEPGTDWESDFVPHQR